MIQSIIKALLQYIERIVFILPELTIPSVTFFCISSFSRDTSMFFVFLIIGIFSSWYKLFFFHSSEAFLYFNFSNFVNSISSNISSSSSQRILVVTPPFANFSARHAKSNSSNMFIKSRYFCEPFHELDFSELCRMISECSRKNKGSIIT